MLIPYDYVLFGWHCFAALNAVIMFSSGVIVMALLVVISNRID
jgi:hypothetical protein